MKRRNRNKLGLSLKMKALSIVLAASLVFSCAAPITNAFAKSLQNEQTTSERNIDSLIARKASSLSKENNYLLGQKIIPEIKTPLPNPIQILINQIYTKVFGPSQNFLENELSDALNWILGLEPGSQGDPDKKLDDIKKSIKNLDDTVKNCHTKTMELLNQMIEDNIKSKVIGAITAAKTLFDQQFKSIDISIINNNTKEYCEAKKVGDKKRMINALGKIAEVDGVSQLKGKPYSKLEDTYESLYRLTVNVGGSSDLKNLFDKMLNSNKNVDNLIKTYHTIYFPFVQYMNKINEYQLISLAALREHERICDPNDKLLKNYKDEEIGNRLKEVKDRSLGVMQSLESLNNRISFIPNLTVTAVYSNKVVETVRYHSLGDAWIAAQNDNVVSAKITLYSDYVYNGEDKNFYGNHIEAMNRNMKFDLNSTVYGKDSDGFFKNGNLNVKSGKNIQLDLNSHTLANLKSNLPTITVDKDANLTLISTSSEMDGRKGQIGGVKFETGSAGCIHNVKFADKYNFKKFEILDKKPQDKPTVEIDPVLAEAVSEMRGNDQSTNNSNYFNYKVFSDIKGQDRNSAAIYNGGATKDFEVCGCDFIELENKSSGKGAGIEINSDFNLMKTDEAGNVTEKCAAADIKECSFIDCKANTGAAISATKHINVVDSIFDGCSAKADGGAVQKFQIEGDRQNIPVELEDQKYDTAASSFSNCKFNNNSSQQCGGAIDMLGSMNVKNTSFAGNSAAQGGAINDVVRRSVCYNNTDYFGNVDLSNSKFDNNRADKGGFMENKGGAVYSKGSGIVSNANEFTNNKASHDGGAICQEDHRQYWYAKESRYANTNFFQNKSGHRGGAVKNYIRANYDDVKMSNNHAEDAGGAIYSQSHECDGGVGVNLRNIIVTNNTCKNGRGAGVLVEKEVYLHNNVVIKDNHRIDGEASDLRGEFLSSQRISPEPGFYEGGSDVGLDQKGTSDQITDQKTETSNKGWIERINKSKQYMHSNDGRSVNVDTWGTWLWQRYWLKVS